MKDDETIAAIATPIGEGGIAIIRISGDDAIKIADEGFRGKRHLHDVASHTAHFGTYLDRTGKEIDEVVVILFRKPQSYTAEDVVEINCHGGAFIAHRILDAVVQCGARPAEPGEFTKRAFLNGRIDLSQAEAVADLIRSRSDISLRSSLQQLRGGLSRKIAEIREKLLNVCSLLELELDFAEDGIELVDSPRLIDAVHSIIEEIEQLTSTFYLGKICREGVKVVLAGRPNVGKSSLLNTLLNEERAIVTSVSGTTRDVIEESIQINGLHLRITDTAGLRKTSDMIELEGIRLAEREIEDADILVCVVDISEGFTSEDVEIIDFLRTLCGGGTRKIIIAINKIDLLPPDSIILIPETCKSLESTRLSAKTGEGIPDLKNSLVDNVLSKRIEVSEDGPLITSTRHYNCLVKAHTSLTLVSQGLRQNLSNELVAIDLRSALHSLGEIIGVVTNEDILNNIFSHFCVGK